MILISRPEYFWNLYWNKINLNFYFHFCGVSEGFMKAFQKCENKNLS